MTSAENDAMFGIAVPTFETHSPPPGKRVLCRVAPGNEIVRSLDVSIDKTIQGSMNGIKIIDELKEAEKQKGQSLGTTSQEEKETAAVVSSAPHAARRMRRRAEGFFHATFGL